MAATKNTSTIGWTRPRSSHNALGRPGKRAGHRDRCGDGADTASGAFGDGAAIGGRYSDPLAGAMTNRPASQRQLVVSMMVTLA